MKSIFYLCAIFLYGCSSVSNYEYDGVKIQESGAKCFDDGTLKNIFLSRFPDPNEKTSHLFIEPIVTNNKQCIGLYGFTFKNLTSSSRTIRKVLKFQDFSYLSLSENKDKNEKMLNKFLELYSESFSHEELEKLKYNYNKGTVLESGLY